MQGLMQDWPLTVPTILDHAAREHGEQEIVTRGVEGPIRRSTYRDLHSRARRVAKGLTALGVRAGSRVATMAWNTDRHMEAWYGIMGMGAVCHTLNPRLFADQLVYIVNHAEDEVLFVDLTFVPLVEKLRGQLPTLKHVIVMTDEAHMPESELDLVAYESWLEDHDDDFLWVAVEERAAAGLCYTSGTTGHPKGVLYSHRSNVLHCLMVNQADALATRAVDAVLPVVPMFHANAWGLAFAVPASGGRLVMPGACMDGASIYELLDTERVSLTAAVPTVWLMLLQYLEATGKKLPYLKRVVIGGSACPRMMIERFEEGYDVEVQHAWGMTETSPLGSMYAPKMGQEGLSREEEVQLKLKQGRPPYLVEMMIAGDDGAALPRDGKAYGNLLVRGPAIAESYFKGEGGRLLTDGGWMPTGDVATLDPEGYMQITDRSKDVIKSGGEWISSIEIENIAVGHPQVAEAAVIGIPHEKWDERPLLVILPKEGETPSKDDVLAFLDGKIAKWWMPDDVVLVGEIPHTATGKIRKKTLRESFADYRWPAAPVA
jgi:3-(methylthio)propionyl---CoA ligase